MRRPGKRFTNAKRETKGETGKAGCIWFVESGGTGQRI